MVEQRTENPWVSGSILLSDKKIKSKMKLFCNLTSKLKTSIQLQQKYTLLPQNSFYFRFLKLLFFEGIISRVYLTNSNKLKVYLKYDSRGTPCFKKINFLSTPGKSSYMSYKEMTKFAHGLGTIVISTNKGLLSHHSCIKLKIGGTALCYIV
jgi:ribosomal protein S8